MARTALVARFGSPQSPIILIAGTTVRSLFDDPPLLFGTLDDLECPIVEARVASLEVNSLVVATATEPTEAISQILLMSQVLGVDVAGTPFADNKKHAFVRRPAEVRRELAIQYVAKDYFRFRFPKQREPKPIELAHAFDLIGRPDRSVEILRRLVGERPGDPELQFYLGQALGRIGEHAEAVTWFERSAAGAPDQIDPRSSLAITLSRLGRYREAKHLHAELIEMTGGDFGEYMNFAQVCENLGELDEAWFAVQQALAAQPGSAHIAAYAAKLAYLRGDLAVARSYADAARQGLARIERGSPMYDLIDKLLRAASAS